MRWLRNEPSGYHAQPAFVLRDDATGWSHELFRVYGPPDLGDRRGATCRLDQDLSYWLVTQPGPHGLGEPQRHSISFAQARKQSPGLTFAGFSIPRFFRTVEA
jgi:hypothetical protein